MRDDLFPQTIREKYEIREYKNAISILYTAYPELFEVCFVLDKICITKQMIITPGGNESQIPKAFSNILRPLGWNTVKLKAEIRINDIETVHTETHKN